MQKNIGKYVIEVVGSNNVCYCIKKVVLFGLVPVNGKAYKTEEAARKAAFDLGLDIMACGDLWHII